MVLAGSLVAAGVLLGRASTPAEQRAERAPEPARPVTAEAAVQRIADIRTGTCELSVSSSTVNLPQGAAGGVVTAVHVRSGAPIRPGTRVLDVSGRPILAVRLPFPLYRSIAPLDEGPDVEALQVSLAGLGLYVGAPSGRHDQASQRAVRELYVRAGAPVPETGPDAAGRLVAAERALAAIDERSRAGTPVARSEVDAALAERDAARNAVGVPVPLGEILSPPAGPIARVERGVGSSVGAGDPILTFNASTATARCRLPVGAAAGLSANIAASLEAGVGEPIRGTLGAVVPGEGELEADFVPDHEISALLGGRSATVEVTVAATDGEALTVPVAALRRGSDGTRVDVVDGSDRRSVAIETGLVAAGWVEVVDGDLRAGDAVVVTRASP